MTNSARTAVTALLFAFLVGSGCSKKPTHAGVLRYPLTEEPQSLDPPVMSSADTAELLQNVFEGLVRFDKQMQIVPWLADSWQISPDKRTYTFHLNPNARFHPPYARQVTAADVKWSIERALWPETKAAVLPSLLKDIVGAQAVIDGKTRECSGLRVVGATTLTVTTVKPCAYMLQELGSPQVYCREAVEKGGGHITAENAIGTGPYILKEFKPGSRVVLEANPDYYRGRPAVTRIERPIVLDRQTAHIQYENNESDFAQVSWPSYLADRDDARLKSQCLLMPWSGVNYLVMQPEAQPAFRDRRVRRAIAEAIDRDTIIRIVYKGAVLKAGGFLPPGVIGYSPQTAAIPYDPVHARKLLAEAGFAGGKSFPHLVLEHTQQNPEVASTAQIIRDNLQQNLGLEVDLREREAATFFSDIGTKKVPFYTVGWIAADPHDVMAVQMRTGGLYNTLSYSNPQFDAAVDRGDAEFDLKKRAAAYEEADRIQLDDVAALPINYLRIPYLVRPTVRGLEYNGTGLMPHFNTRIGNTP